MLKAQRVLLSVIRSTTSGQSLENLLSAPPHAENCSEEGKGGGSACRRIYGLGSFFVFPAIVWNSEGGHPAPATIPNFFDEQASVPSAIAVHPVDSAAAAVTPENASADFVSACAGKGCHSEADPGVPCAGWREDDVRVVWEGRKGLSEIEADGSR